MSTSSRPTASAIHHRSASSLEAFRAAIPSRLVLGGQPPEGLECLFDITEIRLGDSPSSRTIRTEPAMKRPHLKASAPLLRRITMPSEKADDPSSIQHPGAPRARPRTALERDVFVGETSIDPGRRERWAWASRGSSPGRTALRSQRAQLGPNERGDLAESLRRLDCVVIEHLGELLEYDALNMLDRGAGPKARDDEVDLGLVLVCVVTEVHPCRILVE